MSNYLTDDWILEDLKFNTEMDMTFMDQEAVTKIDNRLKTYIHMAEDAIRTEGITLEDTEADAKLVSLYAEFLYEKRKQPQPMPPYLRKLLNNRLLSRKARAVNL